MPLSHRAARLTAGFALISILGCSGADETDRPGSEAASTPPVSLSDLLARGESVFGIFSGPQTAEQGELMGQNRDLDFVFYSLESGPFDIQTMTGYMEGIAVGSAPAPPHPVALRVPPINDGSDQARAHVAEGLQAGVSAIVFPHVESREDAEVAVSAMGSGLWPGNPQGHLVNMLIVEDQVGMAHVDEIVSTPGISVVFAGPGDLRRAYDGDMEAVENAIQTVLAACLANDVPCGITAGAADIEERLDQGFRVIIVTEAEAVPVGRSAAGR